MMVANCNFIQILIITVIACNCINKADSRSLDSSSVTTTAGSINSLSRSVSSPSSSSSSSSLKLCTDHEYYSFNSNRTCEWIREDPLSRCNILDENQIPVRDRCRASCNNCITRTQKGTSMTSYRRTKPTSDNEQEGYPQQQHRSLSDKQKVGSFCLSNSDCSSWICRENTCFASEECKSIKHIDGQQFRRNRINIVFVGSGFHSLEVWRHYVAKTFQAFDHFDFFSFRNPRYNAFYVDELDRNGFCNFNCEGISTLLCCDVNKSRQLANKCFQTGGHLHIVVVHNSDQYGGAGYRYQNLATTSIHPSGPLVAVHELGHSLFELGDEYDASSFTAKSSPNCDLEGCPKWNDLSQHFGIDLCQARGCKNGDYYVAGKTFMRMLNQPMGHSNMRYTCCTYLALTKGIPEYCRKYDFGFEGLIGYCQKDYQGYGGPELYIDDGRTLVNDKSKGKFVIMAEPVRLIIDLEEKSFSYSDADTFNEGPQMILKREVHGDFLSIINVCDSHVSEVIEIVLEFDTGERRKLYFSNVDDIDVPPSTESSEKENVDAFVQPVILDVVVDATSGIVIDIEISRLEITLWFRIRTLIIQMFSNFIGWLFPHESNSSSQTR